MHFPLRDPEPRAARRGFIDDIDPVHTRERGPLATPSHHLLDHGLGPLEDRLDITARDVPDPAGKTELVCEIRAGGTEEDPLDPAGDDDPNPTHRSMVAHHAPVSALR
jgi:hypothetical protein